VHPAWITHLGYALPGPALGQDAIGEWLEQRLAPGSNRERWRRFSRRSGVAERHSVVDLLGDEGQELWPRGGLGHAGTARRSALFEQRALPLATAAVRAAAEDLAGVTHLVVATCTGAVAPGLDLQLVRELGLSRSVRRTLIGFMGCYAAIQALRVARDACRADPSARALVVCCELSSLHFQAGPSDDALLAACLFGDGASAAIVQAAPRALGVGLRLAGDASAIIPDSAGQMVWYAGDQGFVLGLSPAITGALAGDLAPLRDELLGERREAPARWVVHPGGPRILDAAERALALEAGALDGSRRALARGGNRSSGTVLAILADEVRDSWRGPLGMMAFGPGLTAEALLLEREA
jgi:predicted naringenin-chalcone synthase